VASGQWPRGRLVRGVPVAVRYARDISLRLERALDGKVIAQVARDADVVRSTLYDIMSGRSWPDVVSLAKLEVYLGIRLWPDEPPD
jgi:transcriptional regulator with XRE-family HTH domain